MQALTLKLEKNNLVAKRRDLIEKGYTVVFYPALWGGNAHPKNKMWCSMDSHNNVDYGSLRFLERSLTKYGKRYVILRVKKTYKTITTIKKQI